MPVADRFTNEGITICICFGKNKSKTREKKNKKKKRQKKKQWWNVGVGMQENLIVFRQLRLNSQWCYPLYFWLYTRIPRMEAKLLWAMVHNKSEISYCLSAVLHFLEKRNCHIDTARGLCVHFCFFWACILRLRNWFD